MPSRASAVRELIRRGLSAEGFAFASTFGVVDTDGADASTSDSVPKKR